MQAIFSNPAERAAFRAGFHASGAALPGMAAWGMVTGMAMIKSGLTLGEALGMTLLVYAGASQLTALPLLAAHAPVWLVFVTALVVNLRFVIFAAAIGPHFAHLGVWRRLWYGYFNIDMTPGFFQARFADAHSPPAGKLGFYCGIGYPAWVIWQIGSVAGILLGSQIPASWGIGFAGTLALFAILIPLVNNWPARAGALVAVIVAVAGHAWPYRLGLLAALLAGMAAALWVDELEQSRLPAPAPAPTPTPTPTPDHADATQAAAPSADSGRPRP